METLTIGKKYHIVHRNSTMATNATLLEIQGSTAKVSGDRHLPSYTFVVSDFLWIERD